MRIKQFWCHWKEENHTFHQKQKMLKLNEKMENYIEFEFVYVIFCLKRVTLYIIIRTLVLLYLILRLIIYS